MIEAEIALQDRLVVIFGRRANFIQGRSHRGNMGGSSSAAAA